MTPTRRDTAFRDVTAELLSLATRLHHSPRSGQPLLRAVLMLLETGQPDQARLRARDLPLDGNGGFNDGWFDDAEDSEAFETLCRRFSELRRPAPGPD